MPPEPSSDKSYIVIVLVAMVVALLGFFYYKYYNYSPLQNNISKPPALTPPLPEPTDLRFIQGEIVQVVGKTLMVRVNKLVGQDFASSKIVSEEYKVIIGAKTELVKFTSEKDGSQKSAKAVLKDFKKGYAVAAYAEQNLIGFKEFTAVKIELLPR